MARVGTLGQQFAAVSHFLAVPQRIRADLGEDAVWEFVHSEVIAGRVPDLPDRYFRELVQHMRDCQRRVYAATNNAERAAARNLCAEAEWKVDKFLQENRYESKAVLETERGHDDRDRGG